MIITPFNKYIIGTKGLIFLLFFCLLCSAPVMSQQSPMFSQYMFNMMNINPAYAGNRAVNNVTALYRNQWSGFPGSPQSAYISWDKRKQDSNVGYGAQLYNDHLGAENTTGFQGFYSYRIPFKQSTLTLGASAGAFAYGFKLLGENVWEPGDPSLTDENIFVPTFGMGALYFTDKWYVGLSIPTLLKTEIQLENKVQAVNNFGPNRQLFVTGGYIFDIDRDISLKPSFLVKTFAASTVQIDLNMNAWYMNTYCLGASYRTGNYNNSGAFVGLFEYQINQQIRIGYAYDYTLSSINQFSQQTHEVLVRYEFDSNKSSYGIRSPRYY